MTFQFFQGYFPLATLDAKLIKLQNEPKQNS